MDISQRQFTLISDFILVQISIEKANRAGAIANIRTTELNKKFKQDGEYVILVKAHQRQNTFNSRSSPNSYGEEVFQVDG